MKGPTVGERIRKLRGKRLQVEFAKKLGVTQGAVSAWERNDKDRAPSADAYVRLGNLADDPQDSLYFWKQGGLDPQAILSAALKVFRDRFTPPLEGEIYRVPLLRPDGSSGSQPNLPLPAKFVSDPASMCLEVGKESIGYWLAGGDLIVLSPYGEAVSAEAIHGRVVLAKFNRAARGEEGLLLPVSQDGFVMGRLMVWTIEGSDESSVVLLPVGVGGIKFQYLLGSCHAEPGKRAEEVRLLPEWGIVGRVIAYFPREKWDPSGSQCRVLRRAFGRLKLEGVENG